MTDSVLIRAASRTDRGEIAFCVADAFSDEFDILCKDTQKVSKALERGIQTKRFIVATYCEKVVGALAIADCNGRSILTDPRSYRKYFGFIKGSLASVILKDEFVKALELPKTEGYIESVCVLKKFQGKGIATKMLNFAIENTPYNNYQLDVTDINEYAIRCYKKCGFTVFRSEKVKHSKQKGFNAKLFMKYECNQ